MVLEIHHIFYMIFNLHPCRYCEQCVLFFLCEIHTLLCLRKIVSSENINQKDKDVVI